MRKWIGSSVMIVLIFFLATNISKAKVEGVALSETPLRELPLHSSRSLDDIVLLPEGGFDEGEAASIVGRLDRVPEAVLDQAAKKEIKVILFKGNLTDQPSAAHLKGESPRGYNNGTVWDDVPGIGGTKQVLVKIGSSEKGHGHGSVNLELHEFAHSLQHYLFADAKNEEAIVQAWREESQPMFGENHYFLDYEEEFFAECFAYYYYSDETRTELAQHAPSMYRFFEKLGV